MPEDMIYGHLNNEWNRTCKVVLGGEVGELKEFENWLLELKQPRLRGTSSLSGKEVVFSSTDYMQNAKHMSFDEIDFGRKFEPLCIDDTKDIDSILEAVRERIYYSGNIILGTSQFVEKSSSVSNSYYVYESARIQESKNIAYSTICKNSENIFGCNVGSFSNYDIRCHQHGKGGRKFEGWLTWMSSECYYTYNLMGCNDCIFSFNLRSKRNVIGNLALPKEKYLTIKSHLLAQIRDILKQKKRAPSLADIVNECGTPEKNTLVQLANFAKPSEQSGLNPEIEKAFSETASLIFGKPLSGSVCDYSEWLKRHIINVAETESVLGSGKTTVPNYENYHAFDKSRNRFVNLSEASQLSEIQKLGEIEAEKLDFSNVSGLLSGVAFLSAQFHDGVFSNVTNCPIIINSANCYSILGCVNVKDSAFCTWPNGSDHVFGCAFTFNSSFNVNCYSSFNLTRCFEVDSSSNCSDSYFCHNCENVHDSMFCFNSKNLRYAIGNVVVGREQYQRAKSMLQSWLREGFETDKAVDSDIFNIGSA